VAVAVILGGAGAVRVAAGRGTVTVLVGPGGGFSVPPPDRARPVMEIRADSEARPGRRPEDYYVTVTLIMT
jgi:hypothetical protein